MRNNLILASASPRRLKLLEQIHVHPDAVMASDINEDPLKNEKPDVLALRLAVAKAQKIAEEKLGYFILAADTVVSSGASTLPKTETAEQARQCLQRLSGRRHHVYGGIALITPTGKLISRVCDTLVQFKPLTKTEIENYIECGEWNSKAGGYAIQGHAEAFVKFMRGSYSNVVGLSLYDTMQVLNGSGFFNIVKQD